MEAFTYVLDVIGSFWTIIDEAGTMRLSHIIVSNDVQISTFR